MRKLFLRSLFIGIIVSICLTSLLIIKYKSSENTKVVVLNKVKFVEKVTQFSIDELKSTLITMNIKFPHIVLAQAILESGNFKSKVFLTNNNMFGMRIAKSRPTTAHDNGSGYAMYDNWIMSVLDYALFQSAFLRKIDTEEAYYRYLSDNYASDPTYVNKLKDIAKDWNYKK